MIPIALKAVAPHTLEQGQYCKWNGTWYARPPVAAKLIATLAKHDVVEHEDGTITAWPSIDVDAGALGRWHGFLRHGIWSLD